MTSFADKLLAASKNLGKMPTDELAALLLRAAFRIEASGEGSERVLVAREILAAIDRLADRNDMPREVLVAAILRDWLAGHSVHVDEIAEDTETKGSA